MAKNNTRGWYTFENGMQIWYNGLSARERAAAIRKYGRIIRFTPTA